MERFAENLPEDKRRHFLSDWKKQRDTRGRGGADLMKVTKNPMTMPFEELQNVAFHYMLHNTELSAKHPLLQNPNGLVYYKDNANQAHWYCVDRETRTVRKVQVDESIMQDAYTRFKSSMDNMEAMKVRRSSNEECKLINSVMRDAETQQSIQLVREGHQYVRNEIPLSRILSTLNRDEFLQLKNQLSNHGQTFIKFATEDDYQEKVFSYGEIWVLRKQLWAIGLDVLRDKLLMPTPVQVGYCDTQYDFNRYYNAYEKCIRLYRSNNPNDSMIADFIQELELASIQKEVMWLLQRYCEKNRRFYRMPAHYKELPFIRTLMAYKYEPFALFWHTLVAVYDRGTGRFYGDFACSMMFLGLMNAWKEGWNMDIAAIMCGELVGLFLHVEDARANIVKFTPQVDLFLTLAPMPR